MVRDVLIPVYMGASEHTFAYRQFLQVDQCRNIPPQWVGKECEVRYFPSPRFGFHGYPAFVIKTIKKTLVIYSFNAYQILPQHWGKLDSICWAPQNLQPFKNCLKCHQGRGCFSMGWNWGSSLCSQTRGDTSLLPQSLQHLQHHCWLQLEFHTLEISSEKCNFLYTIPSYWRPFWWTFADI